MKKVILLLLLPALFSSFIIINKTGITDEERKFAVDHLKKTQEDLLNAVNGLNEAQLNFKASPERWSVLECVQHITMASQGLWQLTDATLKQNTDTLKSQVKDDQQFIKMVEDRSMKQKAPEEMVPSKSPYHTLAEARMLLRRTEVN